MTVGEDGSNPAPISGDAKTKKERRRGKTYRRLVSGEVFWIERFLQVSEFLVGQRHYSQIMSREQFRRRLTKNYTYPADETSYKVGED